MKRSKCALVLLNYVQHFGRAQFVWLFDRTGRRVRLHVRWRRSRRRKRSLLWRSQRLIGSCPRKSKATNTNSPSTERTGSSSPCAVLVLPAVLFLAYVCCCCCFSYLEQQRFLIEVDNRTFEQEKEMRARNRQLQLKPSSSGP